MLPVLASPPPPAPPPELPPPEKADITSVPADTFSLAFEKAAMTAEAPPAAEAAPAARAAPPVAAAAAAMPAAPSAAPAPNWPMPAPPTLAPVMIPAMSGGILLTNAKRMMTTISITPISLRLMPALMRE